MQDRLLSRHGSGGVLLGFLENVDRVVVVDLFEHAVGQAEGVKRPEVIEIEIGGVHFSSTQPTV